MIEMSQQAAAAGGLRYVTDSAPGISRRRAGRGFAYTGPDGSAVRDRSELRRIRALAIPPAYRDVWICPDPRGHIQATARDDRGRKQYRYHEKWREFRDAAKFDRTLAFATALPNLRRRVTADLALPGLPKQRVLAAIVRLMETTLIRVGNEEYARDNGSFGATTLQMKHVKKTGGGLRFRFRGKSRRFHEISVEDKRLARLIRHCADLPGQDLFQYEGEDGNPVAIGSADVNEYLRAAAAEDFSAKDIRTWHATVLCFALLAQSPPASGADGRQIISLAVTSVAERLGNTPAVCRKSYIHPVVFAAYQDGTLLKRAQLSARRTRGLRAQEAAVVRLIGGAPFRRRLAAAHSAKKPGSRNAA